MATALHKPHLDPTAAVLREAIARSRRTKVSIAAALKVSSGTLSNMTHAKSRVSPAHAALLGKLLGIDPAAITSPPNPGGNGHGGVRTKGVKGPAARALELHQQAPAVLLSPSRPTPVLGMEMLSDGTATVTLRVTLPAERGAALFRTLLDFGVTAD